MRDACGLILFLIAALLAAACGEADPTHTDDGRLIVRYWEHWNGFEHDAMQAVVDDYNASQDEHYVQMLRVSQMEQKFLLATAGGNPPDLVGLWDRNLASFAEKGAITPLSGYLDEAGIGEDHFLPVVWELLQHRGFAWAVPTTPGGIGLHWNRRLFAEAGLDPDRPPQTLDELDAMAETLTVVDVERSGQTQRVRYVELTDDEKSTKQFDIVQLGFSPMEPNWFKDSWGYWFGGSLDDGAGRITADSPENVAALDWVGSYTRKFGVSNMKKFSASFGNSFASPQNPFMDERIAMELQGVWMYNFIDRFAPQLDWSAAAFPSVDPERLGDVTYLECDVLSIPTGAKNPDAAFAFMHYMMGQGPMEKLCLGQRKFSPLAETSAGFVARHPNPKIEVFMDLARGAGARISPKLPVWQEYKTEMAVAADRVFGGVASAEEAAAYVQERMQWKLDRVQRRWDRTGAQRLEAWAAQQPQASGRSQNPASRLP